MIQTLMDRKGRLNSFEEIGLCDPELDRKEALKKVNKWQKGLHFDVPVEPHLKLKKNIIPKHRFMPKKSMLRKMIALAQRCTTEQ